MSQRQTAVQVIIAFVAVEVVLLLFWFAVGLAHIFKDNSDVLALGLFPFHLIVPSTLYLFLEELHRPKTQELSKSLFETREAGWILLMFSSLLVDLYSLIFHIHEHKHEGYDTLAWLALTIWILASLDSLLALITALVLRFRFKPVTVLGKGGWNPMATTNDTKRS